MMIQLNVQYIFHKNEPRVVLRFPKDKQAEQVVRNVENAKWSATHKAWHIPYYKGITDVIKQKFECFTQAVIFDNDETIFNTAKVASIIKPKHSELTELSKEKIIMFKYWLKSKRYSQSTIDTYSDALTTFLKYYNHKVINDITNNDVILFNNDYILAKGLSSSFQNQIVNAIKLFFKTVENKKIEVDLIHRPKQKKLLPNVLSKEEIKLILNVHGNIKHKAMLSLIYSCGLRRSELLNLKLNDIDSKRGVIIIRQAKGKKDRIAPLSEKIVELLRQYYVAYRPTLWLFEGQNKQQQYDEGSLQKVLKQALVKNKIDKPVSLHWLRHSYATHLLEAGTDLRYIQEILGHSSSRTTEIYTHVSNKSIQQIISPFDTL